MKIVDLPMEHERLYFACLEDWSPEAREAGNHKELWYERMKEKGLRVKLALDDNGIPGGMIQYAPIEHSIVRGEKLYFIYCIWVHGHKEGRGNFQKKGMGTALLQAAEEDARGLGAKGMAAWGIMFPFWMKASWFRRHGYRVADRYGMAVLLWKPFCDDARQPEWIRQVKRPETTPGKVTVTAFINGWCMAQNVVYERAKRAALEFGDKVVFQGIDTSDRNNLLGWGIADSLFIDGKEVRTGPPPSYEKIKSMIWKKVRKL